MELLDKLLNTFKDTIFLKDDSNLEKQVEELKKIKGENIDSTSIDKDIKFLEYGIKGENEIAYELKHANLGLYVLRDVTINYEDTKAQIDYIVISKGFTYLIECKNLIGNIYVDDKGQFQREYEFGNKKIKEAIYSPYTQAVRHKEILKKRWISRNSKLVVAMKEKLFDKLWYKPLVVLANSKSILNVKYAPREIKNNIVRVDQLVEYIKKDLSMYDRSLLSNQKEMLSLANSFLESHTEEYNSIANKYLIQNKKENTGNKIEPKNELDNQNDLISELKEFRKEISKEMKIPPFYVFNDEELSKIVSQRPKNIEDLKSVLTPIKIKIHGENIIKIVNKTSSIN